MSKLSEKDKGLLELAERFPPRGKDKEIYDKASTEEKVRLIKQWQREKSL
jgi:hypothetical protein